MLLLGQEWTGWRWCDPHGEGWLSGVNVSLGFSGHDTYHGGRRDIGPIQKSKGKDRQTVMFPSGYRERLTPLWEVGWKDLEPSRPCSRGQDTVTAGSAPASWELCQLP